jgi:transposase
MEQGPAVGIDVAKDQLDVRVLPDGAPLVFRRDGEGIAALVEQLRLLAPQRIGIEATGGIEKVVVAALAAARLPVVVLNPAQVRAYAQALGKRAKTDPIDAEVIARFVQATQPPVRDIPDEAAELLSDLVTRRRQIVQMIGAEKQREKRTTQPRVKRSIARLVTALKKELTDLDGQLDEQIRNSPIWREKEALLTSVPGVAEKTARTLLAELPELGSLDRREVAALAGLCPWTRRSGQWKGKSFIAGGRAPVRSALFIAALVATRWNPLLKAFYEKLLAAGKPKMVALIAVARKLLTILNAILRDKTPWLPT